MADSRFKVAGSRLKVDGSSLSWVQRVLMRLARVEAVAPGRPGDGLAGIAMSGTDLDKPWLDLSREFSDAREAWRKNPLARRLVSLVASFVCGDGITLASDAADLNAFLVAFWGHEQNRMALRQYGLCEELSRSGELFITLHMNPADGMSYVRGAARIEHRPGHHGAGRLRDRAGLPRDGPARRPGLPGGADVGLRRRLKITRSHPLEGRAPEPAIATVQPSIFNLQPATPPVCLHFAVNRPVGCVRGSRTSRRCWSG